MKSIAALDKSLQDIEVRMQAWRKDRGAIVSDLEAVSAFAKQLIQELGHAADGSQNHTQRRGGRPKGFRVSAATKAKLREAWKRRKQKAAATAAKKHVRPSKRTSTVVR